ncbi:MAG: SpvB/TcaC N-terminal domain-containing protein [Patescibacteria group bacterium]
MKRTFTTLLLFSLLIPYNLVAAQEQQENLSVSESTDSQISQTEDAGTVPPPSLPLLDDFLNQQSPADLSGSPDGESASSAGEEEPETDQQTKDNAKDDSMTEEKSVNPADEPATENPIPNPQSAPTDPWLNIAGLQELFSSDLFTGEARLNIPFNAPSGRNGLTPELSLNYSSFKNDLLSPYGYGFDFSNSSIFRTARHGVDQMYLRSDFAVKLGGKYNELVLIDAGLGLYQGKLGNDGNKYFLEGSGANAKWRVLDSAGIQYYFGEIDSSKQFDPNNPEHIFQWMLNKTVDQYGNQITYTYFTDHNQIYPDAIQYVFTDETTSLYRVKFDYLQKSTSATSYQTQFEIATYYVLGSIKIQRFIDNVWQTQKEYSLAYDYLDQAISRLLSITPKAGTLALPSLNFAYYSGGASINLLQTINNNKGGTINLEYLPSTQYIDPDTGKRSQLPFIIDTLHKVTRSDQIAQTSRTQTFNYYEGHYYVDYADVFTREYAGFHKVFSTDSLGQITKTYFHQSEFALDNSESSKLGEYDDHISKKGRTYRQEVYDSAGRLFQSQITKWDKRDLPGEDRLTSPDYTKPPAKERLQD